MIGWIRYRWRLFQRLVLSQPPMYEQQRRRGLEEEAADAIALRPAACLHYRDWLAGGTGE